MLAPESITSSPVAPRWCWLQCWRNLLFAHWPISPDALRPLLPAGVEPDLWEGTGWASVVAFSLERVRRLGWWSPAVSLVELNLRTYVRHGEEPGIVFLSLHADSWLATTLARWFTLLPYAYAPQRYTLQEQAGQFESPLFTANYQVSGSLAEVTDGSLDAWILERYVAFVGDRCGRLRRLQVQHPRWQIRPVQARVTSCRLGEPFGLDLTRPPELCHFAPGVDALASGFSIVDCGLRIADSKTALGISIRNR